MRWNAHLGNTKSLNLIIIKKIYGTCDRVGAKVCSFWSIVKFLHEGLKAAFCNTISQPAANLTVKQTNHETESMVVELKKAGQRCNSALHVSQRTNDRYLYARRLDSLVNLSLSAPQLFVWEKKGVPVLAFFIISLANW